MLLRTLLPAFIFACLFVSCATLIKYDASIKVEFDQLTKKSQIPENDDNIVMVADYRIDTLNKQDYKTEHVKIAFVNPVEDNNSESSPNILLLFCRSRTIKDTLIVEVSYPFDSQTIEQKLVNNSVKITLNETYKNNILKSSLNAAATDILKVATKITQFKLSDNNYTLAKTLYGKAEIMTNPYYIADSKFKGGYLKKKIYAVYYFRLTK